MDHAGGKMNDRDMVNLMNDNNMVYRYSKHLNKIFFRHSDGFIKEKFNRFMEHEEPSGHSETMNTFFKRMEDDTKHREEQAT